MTGDAEFDAFLSGESDLARRLQAMAGPGPSAALDAAIVARARADMAQDARPAAANDSGDDTFVPRRMPGLGWRWRIPAGIAATLLVGVFAQQSFQQHGVLNEVVTPAPMVDLPPAAPAADVAPAVQDAEVMAPAAPPPPAPAPAPADDKAAPAPQLRKPAVLARERMADAAEKAEAESRAREYMNESKSKAAKAVTDGFRAREEVAAPVPAPAPAPAPVASYAPPPPAAPAAAAPQLERQAAPRMKGDALRASSSANMMGGLAQPAPEALAAAREWLDRIEKLLEQGRKAEAVEEWKQFRAAYPGYPVPGTTREKLE